MSEIEASDPLRIKDDCKHSVFVKVLDSLHNLKTKLTPPWDNPFSTGVSRSGSIGKKEFGTA
ncbi:MAG: hypothetical protein D6690_02550 [Nitrospirae bacterium]|nr:MAG: hypothetical protein D6690_02550 [Nitrospirota bacterium]